MAEANRLVQITLVGWRNPRSGRFQAVSGRARDRQRAATRALLRRMKERAEELSPVGKPGRAGLPGRPGRSERQGRQGRPGRQRFKASWRITFEPTERGGAGALVNVAPHAPYVIYPTRPHVIRARRARVLAFEGRDGRMVFRREVFHPGTKGNDVPGKVLKEFKGEAERELRRVAVQVVADIADVFDGFK
jgi:hypothetical protein